MRPASFDKLVGRSLGEFVLREQIGEGGFGAVYRAIQPALDREAVVKVLQARLQGSAAMTERFLREAKLASKLDHPYAAHVYAFGAEPDGQLWIAMELVRGTSLDKLLDIQGPLPLERFVQLLDRVCEVVHTAHEQGIIHRDLKPANVMVLARAGRLLPKLLDFGIAKGLAREERVGSVDTLLDRKRAPSFPPEPIGPPDNIGSEATLGATPASLSEGESGVLTQEGVIIGSPHYMAPEQWLDAGQADARTDLYALGILAFEALTGKPPFNGTTISAIAKAHASDSAPRLGAKFPSALDGVFAKVLAKDPPDRYPDALTFARAFRHAAGIGDEVQLPAIDAAIRERALNNAPQPIAEAIAALEAARNAHQARDAVFQLVRTVARYIGLLALACRSRISGDADPPAVSDAIRALYQRTLSDAEWLELARQLTRSWIDRRDAYPIPELVDVLHEPRSYDHFVAVVALRNTEVAADDVVAALEHAVARVSKLLEALAFLDDYALVVTINETIAERWMGVRRTQRTTTPVRGKGLGGGMPALLDKDGAPVLTLSPLFQVAPPTPGAPLDLFLLEGRDRHGAQLVALPARFERHDNELWDWLRAQLTGSFDEGEATVAEERPPYRGLLPFSADDSAVFVGREKLVDAFVNRLRVQPLLAVVGRSGAGKSSFVHAGVIPALGWRALTMRPGASPIGALVARLEHAGVAVGEAAATTTGERRGVREQLRRDREALGDALRADAAARGPILLLIDQLEEMFTLCQDADERRAFAEAVGAAARTADDPVRVVFTLRDDFLVRTEQVSALRNRIGQGLQLLTVPSAEDLLRILIEPARRSGYHFEDAELPAEMVKEVAEQPGALPLISFTAAKLWELRDRHFKQLTRKAYKALGGVGGALARHAEHTLDAMPVDERALTREAFRYLVTTSNTRAVLARTELRQLLGGKALADAVIEKLVGARLLVASENEAGDETIEIVHEALLIAWPRLVEWSHEDAEGARFRELLRNAAKQWDERDRPKGLLWRGDALADYTRWRKGSPGPLTDVESAFAHASLADAALGRRLRRLALAAVLAASVVGMVVLQRANRIAERNAAEARSEALASLVEQGRVALVSSRPQEAMLYLSAAYSRGADEPNLAFMLGEARRQLPIESLRLKTTGALVTWAAFTRDGSRIVANSDGGSVGIWDRRTGKLERTLEVGPANLALYSLTDDGGLLTYSTKTRPVMWDVATGTVRFSLGEIGARASLSPDQKTIVTIDGARVALWNARDGSAMGSRALVAVQPLKVLAANGYYAAATPTGTAVGSFDLSPPVELAGATQRFTIDDTGHHVAAVLDNHREVLLWDIAHPNEPLVLTGHTGDTQHVAFSGDSKWLATSSRDHTAKVWDVATGKLVATMNGHDGFVLGLQWSPDSTRLATGSFDQTARLWDAQTGARRGVFYHSERVYRLAFDTSGDSLVTTSFDGNARVFDARTSFRVIELGHDGPIELRFSDDGRRLLAVGHDGSAWILDVASGSVVASVDEYRAAVEPTSRIDVLGLHACGDIDATGSHVVIPTQRSARLIAVADRKHPLVLGPLESDVTCARFTRDGRIVVATAAGAVAVWTSDGKLVSTRKIHDERINDVAIDRVSGLIATASDDAKVKLFAVDGNGAPKVFADAPGAVHSVAFSHDGRWVAAASQDTVTRIYGVGDGKLLSATHELADLFSVDFSPDDLRVAVAATDGTIVVRGRTDGRLLARYGDGTQGFITATAFGPQTPILATGDDRGTIRLSPVDVDRRPAEQLAAEVACTIPLRLDENEHLISHRTECAR